MNNEYNKPFAAKSGFQKIVDTVSDSYHQTPIIIDKENSAFEHAIKLLIYPIVLGTVVVKAVIDQVHWKK